MEDNSLNKVTSAMLEAEDVDVYTTLKILIIREVCCIEKGESVRINNIFGNVVL